MADELDVPQHVLRFWETKFTQVKPLKRGGGRRYYRPEDVDLLRRIRGLLYDDGYTIKGVQRLMREGGLKARGRMAADTLEQPPRGGERRHAKAAPEAGSWPRRNRKPPPPSGPDPGLKSDRQWMILELMLRRVKDLRSMIKSK